MQQPPPPPGGYRPPNPSGYGYPPADAYGQPTYGQPPMQPQYMVVAPPSAPAGVFTCPFCRYQGPPLARSKVSTGGWIMFVVLLLFCFPLFWIGLLMKDHYRVCSGCGTTVGGVG